MKRINHTTATTIAPGGSPTETIRRFIDGLTTPAEERQLLAALEAKETQGSLLSNDEQAALALLRLSFPEEDTKALLTEDLSAEYEALTAVSLQASAKHGGRDAQSAVPHAIKLHSRIRRIAATVAAVAAILALALITVLGKRNGEDALIAQTGQSVSTTNHDTSEDGNGTDDVGRETQPPRPRRDIKEKETTTSHQVTTNPAKSFVAQTPTKQETAGRQPYTGQTATLQSPEDAQLNPYQDSEGTAILAAEQQRIREMEIEARERAIAATQENTLACITAASPS